MRLEDALHHLIPLVEARPNRDLAAFLAHDWSGAVLADRHRWRSLALFAADVAAAKVHVAPSTSVLSPARVIRPEISVAALLDLHSGLVVRVVPVVDDVPVAAGDLAIPERSLVMVDERLAAPEFLLAVSDGEFRHFLAPAGDVGRWRVVKPIDERAGDYLVEMRVPWSRRLPDSAPYALVRLIRYQRPGVPDQAFITSLVDAHAWPRHELVAVHSERWIAGMGRPRRLVGKRALLAGGDDVTRPARAHLSAALWAYNLVREQLLACAAELGVEPGVFEFAAVAEHLDVESVQAAVDSAALASLADLSHVAADLVRGPMQSPVRLHIEPRA